MQAGYRKFIATCSAAGVIMGLSFTGLCVDKLTGQEFVSAIYATCFLVGGFLGLNVTSKLVGKMGEQP